MIKSLYIKDFALIENCNIDFSSGLNVIIGETGSGKSLLIDALSIAFGARANTSIIRNDANKCIIEILLDTDSREIMQLLNANEIESENNILIIRREISHKAGSRNFINDTPASLNLVKQIGELYIDFHGQNEHQSLFNTAKHIEIFDKAIGIDSLLETYSEKYNSLKETISNYVELIRKEKDLNDKNEFTRFKLEEINSVNPNENEDEILESELNILENSESLNNLTNELFNSLYDSDSSAWNLLSQAKNTIGELSKIDTVFSEYESEIESTLIAIREISSYANKYNSNIDFNPIRIEEIRQRLSQLKLLQKKYGSISDILELKKELESEYTLYNDFSKIKSDLISKIDLEKQELLSLALKIEIIRKDNSVIFSNKIIDSLLNLGIPNSIFEVKIDRLQGKEHSYSELTAKLDGHIVIFAPNGINNVEFYISTNLGEGAKPLRLVASGGEVSRVMLAIKNILADKDNIACLVFDEIDTGVSGRIAQMVGNSMRDLAKYHQILAISHLPQISAVSDSCILVRKYEEDNKTYSIAQKLNEEEKVIEVAKLMSGENVSDANIKSAYELINNNN